MGAFFKALQLMGIVSEWSTKALEDGKVTAVEATELAQKVCVVLGIPLELDLTK